MDMLDKIRFTSAYEKGLVEYYNLWANYADEWCLNVKYGFLKGLGWVLGKTETEVKIDIEDKIKELDERK